MKKYLIFVFLTFSFSLFSRFLYADNFNLTQDYQDSRVFVTTLFSIDELPLDNHELYTIEYNPDHIVGAKTENLENNVFWQDHITTFAGRYRRIAGLNDFVWLPPTSKLGISVLIKNESGHEVTFRDWMFFVTRNNKTMGSLEKFGVDGTFAHVKYKYMGFDVIKEGDFVFSPLIVDVEDGETKLVKLMSLEMHQPLKVQYFEWTPTILENGDLVIDFVLKLKNIGEYYIGGVEFLHGDYYLKRNFSAGTDYTYQYQVNYGSSYSSGINLFDSFEIKRPGVKTECIVRGSETDNGTFGDTKTLVYERSDESEGVFSKMVDVDWYPGVESMCTTLIGYNLVGKKLEYSPPLDVDLNLSQNLDVVSFDDDLVLKMKITNKGIDIDSLDAKLNFDSKFQLIKSSDCNISVVDSGILWHIERLNSNDELVCEIVFEILEKFSFLNLKNTLVLDGDELSSVFFKFIPDLEISFNYDFLTREFVFQSSVQNINSFSSSENSREGFVCRSILFFNLEDEICI